MLYPKRMRHKALLEAETAGASFWTDEFSYETRVRVLYRMGEVAKGASIFFEKARYEILRSEGKTELADYRLSPEKDFAKFAQDCESAEFPVVIEAMYLALRDRQIQINTGYVGDWAKFESEIQMLLLEDRISFIFHDGQMLSRGNQLLQSEIISPLNTLLSSDSKWRDAELAFQKGLKEMSVGDAPDAITDFSTALASFFSSLGLTATTLGKQSDQAVASGVFSGRDKKLVDWIAGERNEGEAHRISHATLDDAWLMAHVVGAFMLRLSKDDR